MGQNRQGKDKRISMQPIQGISYIDASTLANYLILIIY